MRYILEHWRTSLGGLIMAVLLAIEPLAMGEEAFNFQEDWTRYLIVILIAIVGFIIKDPTKKGGAEILKEEDNEQNN